MHRTTDCIHGETAVMQEYITVEKRIHRRDPCADFLG
jgi:hypothetical protein